MVSAQAWFVDCTYLHRKEDVDRIFEDCWKQGYVAIIDWSADRNAWIFHTLDAPQQGQVFKKEIAAEFQMEKVNAEAVELWLENQLCVLLSEYGHSFQRQVRCSSGIIDVVTTTTIIELKYYLSRTTLFQAIGQVLAYRESYNRALGPVILAKSIDPSARDIAVMAGRYGVKVVIWDGISDKSQEKF